ncbi:MAG: hypothetical protein ABWK15_05050 [Dissulfuribacterales bacterium]
MKKAMKFVCSGMVAGLVSMSLSAHAAMAPNVPDTGNGVTQQVTTMEQTQTTDMSQQNSGMGAMYNFRGANGPQNYPAFSVDTSQDPFVNRETFRQLTGGMNFVDENGDGICDIVQDTPLYHSFGVPFVDENGDGICDIFQTYEAYQALHLKNFVDVDGDGICDNYEIVPR